MTLHLVNEVAKDGGGTGITGGARFNDESGTGAGPIDQVAVLIDSTQAEILGTTADAAVAAGAVGSIGAKLRAISRDIVANIVLAAGANVIGGITAAAAAFADGAIVTIGLKTDAKSTATDATSVSAMSVWKQISFSIQALATALSSLTNTTSALDVNIKSTTSGAFNNNGLAAASGSAPVVQAPTTTDVDVVATITASAYTAGNVIGGILTFASLLDSVRFSGILHSIAVKFKGTAVTGNITVNLFKASPSNGTYTDKTAPTWNAADMANMVGSYVLTAPVSNLGTMTIYNLDSIGKLIQGTTQSVFAVVTVAGTPTPASTSDMTVSLGVLPG